MAYKTEPTTKAGRALAAWNRRSQSMAATIARIEAQAVDDWLGSDDAQQRLEEALAANIECTANGARYDARTILDVLRAMRDEIAP